MRTVVIVSDCQFDAAARALDLARAIGEEPTHIQFGAGLLETRSMVCRSVRVDNIECALDGMDIDEAFVDAHLDPDIIEEVKRAILPRMSGPSEYKKDGRWIRLRVKESP